MTWLSCKTPMVGPTGTGPGAAVALVPALVPGTLLSQTNLLTICFLLYNTILASRLHICWDSVGCSLWSSEDWPCVPPVCKGKWTPLPPPSLPYTCSLIRPFPFFPPLYPFPLPSGVCQFVPCFHASGSIFLIFCFVHKVSVKGEIICYLSSAAWVISLSLILSSSIHVVTFFFLLHSATLCICINHF